MNGRTVVWWVVDDEAFSLMSGPLDTARSFRREFFLTRDEVLAHASQLADEKWLKLQADVEKAGKLAQRLHGEREA